MNSQTVELELVESPLEVMVPDDRIRNAISSDAPDFLEIILTRKKLLAKVEKFDPVESPDDTPRMADAKRLRLDLVKCRTGLEAVRKKVQEEARKVVDGVNEMFRGYREENESAEDFLKESEEFDARYDASRRAELAVERAELLRPWVEDVSQFMGLGEKSEAEWGALLAGCKAVFEQKRKDEAERLELEKADREERNRLRQENERLVEKQRRKDAEALRERQEIEHKASLERRTAEAKLMEERRQREALERQEREREAAERQKQEDAKKAAAKAARAPEKTKLELFAGSLEELLTHAPSCKSDEAKAILTWIQEQGNKFVGMIRQKAANL